MIRMTREEIAAERDQMDARATLNERTKKLEERADMLEQTVQDYRSFSKSFRVGQQGRIEALEAELSSRWVPRLGDRIVMLECELEEQFRPGCAALENALADASRDHVLLTRLVERMGRMVSTLTEWYCNEGPLEGPHIESSYPLTVIGQREYGAAMHKAEGKPEGHELVEDVQ